VIRVLLVDDHSLLRQGLRHAFERTGDLEVVGEAAGLAEARVLERSLTPDVAVVDLNLGDGDGLDLVAEIRARRPHAGLVVLTMYDADDRVLAALDAGASAYVLKSAPADDVIAAARQAARAPGTFSAPDLAGVMRRRLQEPAVKLTPREDEILQLLARGASIAEVAGGLYISQSTAKTHVARLYDKLGAGNRTQAVMAAVRLGLVESGRS
jgi:DNA-binding NarL/FixJ family response regulator